MDRFAWVTGHGESVMSLRDLLANLAPLLAIPSILFIVIGTEWRHRKWGPPAIEDWCAENGWSIVTIRRADPLERWFRLGCSNLQSAYRAVLEDVYGCRREYWFVYGSWWMGPWEPRLEVRQIVS